MQNPIRPVEGAPPPERLPDMPDNCHASHHAGHLGATLKQRHVVMLSIGGSVGAGLFVFSGHAITQAGPAAIIAYVFASLLVVLIMRMLGEMAVAMPDSGSFSTYASKSIGPWAGFSIGWMYWWFWTLVVPLEAMAAGDILHRWYPEIAGWQFAGIVTMALMLVNLASVKNYGETEFWFALIKVVAILIFIGLGVVAVCGGLPNVEVSPLRVIAAGGGFMPHGWAPIVGAMLTTMFTFLGTEIVTIAAAESANPAREIKKAISSVVWRIGLFYIGSVLVIILIVPSNDPMLVAEGSYQAVLRAMKVPYAGFVIDALILVAVGSCLNSAFYTASRMLFSLGMRDQAPGIVTYTNRAGTPIMAVVLTAAVSFVCVSANYLAPKQVFQSLLSTTGAIALLVYLAIAVSQLLWRRSLPKDTELAVRMWLHPYLGYTVVVLVTGAFGVMLHGQAHRGEVMATMGLAAILGMIGAVVSARARSREGRRTDA